MPTALRYLLCLSLLANVVGLISLTEVIRGRGGLAYLRAYFQKDPDARIDTGAVNRAKLFSAMPIPEARPVVFLGDSLTAGCEWQEILGHRLTILNRGIGGDTSAGVLKRVSDVSKLHPLAVFLLIGTNDAQSLGYTPADTARNIRAIINAILPPSSDTLVFIQSILPSRAPKFNKWSEEVNKTIRQFSDGKGVRYIDLRPAFLDTDQLLGTAYTHDGLHLTAEGYFLWKRQLDPIIQDLEGL